MKTDYFKLYLNTYKNQTILELKNTACKNKQICAYFDGVLDVLQDVIEAYQEIKYVRRKRKPRFSN